MENVHLDINDFLPMENYKLINKMEKINQNQKIKKNFQYKYKK